MLSATVNCKLPNIIVTMFVGHQQPLQWHVHSWLNCFPVLIACNSNYYGCNWYDMSNCLLEFHCGRYECVVVIKICKLNLCLQCFAECWRMDIGVGTKWKVGRLTYMASAVARAYNGGLGAEPPAGSRGRAPGQGARGAKPPWSWKLFAFWHLMEWQKRAAFLCFVREIIYSVQESWAIAKMTARCTLGLIGYKGAWFLGESLTASTAIFFWNFYWTFVTIEQ